MRQSCAVFLLEATSQKKTLYCTVYIYIRLLNTLMWHWISRPTARFGCYSLSASGQKPCDIIVFHWETKRLTWKLFHTVSEARMKQESRTDGWMDGWMPAKPCNSNLWPQAFCHQNQSNPGHSVDACRHCAPLESRGRDILWDWMTPFWSSVEICSYFSTGCCLVAWLFDIVWYYSCGHVVRTFFGTFNIKINTRETRT